MEDVAELVDEPLLEDILLTGVGEPRASELADRYEQPVTGVSPDRLGPARKARRISTAGARAFSWWAFDLKDTF